MTNRKRKKTDMEHKHIAAALAAAFAAQAYAATPQAGTETESVALRYTDSLHYKKAEIDAMPHAAADGTDPSVARLFMPATFYGDVAGAAFTPGVETGYADRLLMRAYMERPEAIGTTGWELDKVGTVPEEKVEKVAERARESILYAPVAEEAPAEPGKVEVEVEVAKPDFWKFSGDYYLQFLQNYVSSNWYKGGESNYSMVGSLTLQANYNNKQKVKWDNKLEMKLGFQTSRGDTLHSLKTSEDLIRYTSKLGLQATKRWYYTLQVLAYTQFMRNFASNDPNVYSDFMSPFTLNVSLGMDYNAEWFDKKLIGTIHLAPLAYNFKYVDRLALSTRYGIKEGRHTLNDFGSQFTVDMKWQLADNISWKTRIYGYTTYKRVEFEWENTLAFQFNKYISTNLFVFPRFDDGAKRDADHGYWQLKEYASVGFNYSF